MKDGLSQSFVYSIAEDEEGFIWIATQDGLNRFDGESFKDYKSIVSNPKSIADNFIRKVFIDSDNTLWVGTSSGLSRYDRELDQFTNFYHQEGEVNSLADDVIWDIFEDSSRSLWVSTSLGLHKFNQEEGNFQRIRIRGFESKLREVKKIYQDKKENYWFGTFDNGIYVSNKNLTYTFGLHESNNRFGLSVEANSLFDIRFFEKYYWLATDIGLIRLNDSMTQAKAIDLNLSKSDANLEVDKTVRAIEVVSEDQLWLGTHDGVILLDVYSFETSKQNTKDSYYSLSSDKVYSLFQSKLGKVFIGTKKGLNVFNPPTKLFEHVPINETVETITETDDGNLWFITVGRGLQLLSEDGVIQLPFHFANNVNYLTPSTNNTLLALTNDNEVYQIDSQSLSYKLLSKIDIDLYTSHFNFLTDKQNKLWFTNTQKSLVALDLNTSAQVNLSDIDNIVAIDIYENSIWLLSEQGVYEYTPNISELKKFDLPEELSPYIEISESIKISKSWIWLTSQSNGLIAINRGSKVANIINTELGLINDTINSIEIDQSENAWLTTTKGVSVVNSKTSSVQNFYNDFKLESNEPILSSAELTNDNFLYYGGTDGIHRVDIDKALNLKKEINEPILTNLKVLNKNISPTKNNKSILKSQLSQTDLFTLSHADSPFSIEFVSPNASLNGQLGYKYRLTGLDSNWIETDTNNKRATYTNLSAGLYTFEVQAFDKYHPEIRKSKTIKINILPPWWLSSTAIFAYVLMIMAIVAYFIQQGRYKRQYNLQIKKSEERLKLSLWGSGDEMWDWNISTGKIYRSNIWGILEFPQDGRRNLGTEQTNIHPQDIPRVREALNEHFEDDSTHFEATYRVKGKNEKWMWILDRGKIVERDKSNEPTRMTGTLKDISHIKTAEERLKLFAKCIENISDAVIIYDRQFITVDVNKAYQKITGINRQSMLGKSMKFTRYSETFNQNVKKHLITKGSWHGEIESIRADKELYLTDLNIDVIRDENNNISHFVGVFSDITQRKKTEAELRKLANSDTLTGLPNRSYFQANQAKLVNNKIPHALLVFDLDNFKKINDSMGHEVGDVLLCKVADRMLNVGRKQDSVYRLGGDEFSLIIENTNDIHTITTIAKDILKTIAQPLKLKSQELVLYSSIGIVLFPEDGASPQELLKNADTAMYHAKDQGGNKYQFFSESMNKQAVKRLQIENLIRHGLKEDFFSVFFQPKIEISTGKISGMEALVRFETPTKGIISPGVFIPVSEETGQIIDIGEVVLRKSCVATKKWVEAGLFKGRIAVNLSAVQFTQPNLVKMISDILDETGLEAKYLELEITEGTVMDSPQEAIDTMLQIRAMGIHLSLDDFGTGYSSLAYLKKFPLNTLKIDKAFVDDIELSDQGRNMVATIVTIAHNLGMNVVAEGVETEPQLSFLAGLRCEQMQGYLYSKPLSEKDFQNYLVSYRITDKSTKFITP